MLSLEHNTKKQKEVALDKIKSTLRLKDLTKFNRKKAVKLIKKAGKDEINEDHLEAFIKIFPQAAEVVTETLQVVSHASEKTGEEGKQTLECLNICIESLRNLSQREDLSDEVIKEITRTTIEAAKIVRQINLQNKAFWAIIIAIICLPIIILTGGKLKE